eukprot:4709043-Pyramimonas_sp.AAC.1
MRDGTDGGAAARSIPLATPTRARNVSPTSTPAQLDRHTRQDAPHRGQVEPPSSLENAWPGRVKLDH